MEIQYKSKHVHVQRFNVFQAKTPWNNHVHTA